MVFSYQPGPQTSPDLLWGPGHRISTDNKLKAHRKIVPTPLWAPGSPPPRQSFWLGVQGPRGQSRTVRSNQRPSWTCVHCGFLLLLMWFCLFVFWLISISILCLNQKDSVIASGW